MPQQPTFEPPVGAAEKQGEDPRREFLIAALKLGLFAGGLGWRRPALADFFGQVPSKLPQGRSIFDLRGDVRVNGEPARKETVVAAGDRVTVGKGGHAVFAVGDSAFIVREDSDLQMSGSKLLVRGLRLLTGALLSVVGRRDDSSGLGVTTQTATIGIRGTGFYTEADAARTYFCTCYGVTNVAAGSSPGSNETIVSRHHDAPRYILAAPESGQYIVPAPFLNHTDLELMILEALVGRTVPFGIATKAYDGPQRDDY
ncbi:MAG: FecR domain-containing protein [Nevskia sp.]|nr:FecR domain-containing protein [Nevskia sp.]